MIYGVFASAQPKGTMTLNEYLGQVKAQNHQARALIETVTSAESRLKVEPESDLATEIYANYNLFDDQKQTPQPVFMGTETRGSQWRAGLRKQTSFGLDANLYFNSQRTVIVGANPAFLPLPDYNEAKTVLELNQALWRNSFGEATRADIEAKRAAIQTELMQARFDLKNLLMDAQNTYWALVSHNQIVKLQEDNVDRARKLRDRMSRGARLRLFDDTDAMQAEASFQTRELELQTSLDERAALVRMFNTLRGLTTDEVPALDDLPTKEFAPADFGKGRMAREDFDLLRARAAAEAAQAKSVISRIRPQLDLVGSLASNGRDGATSRSYDLATSDKYPTWAVGVNFSMPIDITLIFDTKRAYRAKGKAAEDMKAQADYNEERAWRDLVQQQREAFGRYQRSISVEKIQTDLVRRERQRLNAGRATTFEALNIEQGLALAQIQRVRAQLAFLQIHNALKTFEATP
jgi:outer membrane protein TolC